MDYLQVKTVAEGSNKNYDRTNVFYRSLGFKKLEIFPSLWDTQNPCQILIKRSTKVLDIRYQECYTKKVIADLAQLVEQRTRNA